MKNIRRTPRTGKGIHCTNCTNYTSNCDGTGYCRARMDDIHPSAQLAAMCTEFDKREQHHD